MAQPKGNSRPQVTPTGKKRGQREDAYARKLRFVEALLLNDGNNTKAALAVGFSPKTAAQQGSRLARSVEVKALLEQRRGEALAVAQAKTNLTVERVLESLARAVLFDPRKLVKADGTVVLPHELDENTALAISGMEFQVDKNTGKVTWAKYKGPSRDMARDQALKHLGLFKEDNDQTVKPMAEAIQKLASIGPLKAAFAKRLGGSA
jgi:phage terminase small subunit